MTNILQGNTVIWDLLKDCDMVFPASIIFRLSENMDNASNIYVENKEVISFEIPLLKCKFRCYFKIVDKRIEIVDWIKYGQDSLKKSYKGLVFFIDFNKVKYGVQYFAKASMRNTNNGDYQFYPTKCNNFNHNCLCCGLCCFLYALYTKGKVNTGKVKYYRKDRVGLISRIDGVAKYKSLKFSSNGGWYINHNYIYLALYMVEDLFIKLLYLQNGDI